MLTSEISGADELELVIWMDARGRRAKGRDHTGRRRRARRPRPESERVAAGHGPAEAWSAGAATPRDGRDTGAGRGGRGGSTTMLSSPGCPRVPRRWLEAAGCLPHPRAEAERLAALATPRDG